MRWTLDPKTLRLFVSVAELGTIAAAAKRENIAASALSKRISDLEYSIGVPLISRSNFGITLTDAGETLLALARRALNDFGALHARMSEYAKGVKGHLRVVANISTITQFLPRQLQSFLAIHSDVRVQLEDTVSSDVVRRVIDNSADIGFLVMGQNLHGAEFFPYQRDELVVICPAEHPLSGRDSVRFVDTVDYQYVGLPANSSTNFLLIKAAGELERAIKLTVLVNSYDALCQMVESGLGLGVLPRPVAESYSRALDIKILTLDEDWAGRTLGYCVRSYDALPIVAKQFVDHINRHRPADLA